MAALRMDKTQVRIVRMADQDREDLAYWLSRPMAERIAAVEVLRRRYMGLGDTVDADAEPRLQRVCRVTRLASQASSSMLAGRADRR
jgi:hypothetical protein